jgi:hypothetical protein
MPYYQELFYKESGEEYLAKNIKEYPGNKLPRFSSITSFICSPLKIQSTQEEDELK